jgi:8-oxo-dGTP pyrophosphatase MutT (NUDIX family)
MKPGDFPSREAYLHAAVRNTSINAADIDIGKTPEEIRETIDVMERTVLKTLFPPLPRWIVHEHRCDEVLENLFPARAMEEPFPRPLTYPGPFPEHEPLIVQRIKEAEGRQQRALKSERRAQRQMRKR